MRRYSRFGPVPESAGLRLCEEEGDVPGPAEGEGNRLLMGQWHYKAEVSLEQCVVSLISTFMPIDLA